MEKSAYRNTSKGKKAQLITTLRNGETTSADNDRAGFISCGLYPFPPQTVLNKLPTYTSPTEIGVSKRKFYKLCRGSERG